MKKIDLYLKEALVNHKIGIKYHPSNTKELAKYIQIELDKGNTNLNCIDTSQITDMSWLFSQYQKNKKVELNIKDEELLDISQWDVSNVTDMRGMFYHCEYFNCDLSKWDVSSLKSADYMFCFCKKFKCDLNNWNPKKLKAKVAMFSQSGIENNKPNWAKKNKK